MYHRLLFCNLISIFSFCVAAENNEINNPTVNSLMYSGAQFPQQNTLSGNKGQKYHEAGAKEINNPTVNSMLYSGSQFPQQNELSGQKGQKYYNSEQRKVKQNNPNINSRLYSGAQFNEQDSFNNDGKSVSKGKLGASFAK